jgi:multiple sugar transport system ATP-binding protein
VFENMAFGLRVNRTPKEEVQKRVHRAATILGLEGLLDRKPRALSGGQRQRVAMGRAIVREPQTFLMDEPLSNLDAKLRVQTRAELTELQQQLGTTMIYVTHDQTEAMTMGQRVAVMRKGHLEQVASPQELYDLPVNLFVGGFIGSPSMNMLEAQVERQNGATAVRIGEQPVRLSDELLAARRGLAAYVGRDVIVGIRPEDLEDAALEPDASPESRLRGRLRLREALGSEIIAHIAIDARPAVTDEVRELAEDVGDDRRAEVDPESLSHAVIVGRFGARSRAVEGEDVEAVVDTRSLHFFDPETGLGIYDQPGGGGT